MTCAELERFLHRLGIETHVQAEQLFRRDKSSFSLLCSGKRNVPPELEAIVRLMLAGTITIDDIERALARAWIEKPNQSAARRRTNDAA
jgi:hypothetical protein